MKKEYFYTDESGKMQKYVYCIRGCEQPYKKDQIGIDISKVSDHSYVCKKCAKELALKCELTNQSLTSIFDVNDMETINDMGEIPETHNIENVLAKEAIINETQEEVKVIKKEVKKTEIKEKTETKVVKETGSSFYAYVLKCNDGTYFCSVTTCELEKAVKNHNGGNMSSYTKARRPVSLEKSKQVNSLEEAKKIKTDYEKIYKN